MSINDWSTKSWNLYATHRRLVPEDFDDEGKDDQEKLSQVVKMDFPDRLFVFLVVIVFQTVIIYATTGGSQTH